MHGSELVPVVTGLRSSGAAAHSEKHHSGQPRVSCGELNHDG